MQYIEADIFFDNGMNVIISPTLRDKIGIGRSSIKYMKLEQGWSNYDLAQNIMIALEISKKNEIEEYGKSRFWENATGIKSFSTFSKKYQCISIAYFIEKDIYKITKNRRFKDGSYGLNPQDLMSRVRTYSGCPSVDTIADLVLDALKIE